MQIAEKMILHAVSPVSQLIIIIILLLAFTSVVEVTCCQVGCNCNDSLSLTCFGIDKLEENVPPYVRNITINGHLKEFSAQSLLPANVFNLDLSSNELTGISSESFDGLTSLAYLNLSRNNITNISQDAFLTLTNLVSLDLSNNKLAALLTGVFSHLVHLEYLDLHNNFLPVLPNSIFKPLENLEMLDLSYNYLTYIPPLTLMNNSILKTVDLRHNLLQTFHEDLLLSFSNLHQVSLEGNPIDCSCVVQEFLVAYNNNPELFYNFQNLTCHSPPSLAGDQVLFLNYTDVLCEGPHLDFVSANMSIVSHQNIRLDCNATGSPRPSIVWVTPWGDLFAHDMHLHLLTSISQPFLMKYTYLDSKYSSDIYISNNGSLFIQNLRGYFGGRFRCLAINPLGNNSATLVLKVYSLIPSVYTMSLVVSLGASLSFLLLGILFGSIRILVHVINKRKKNFKVSDQDPEIQPVEINSSTEIEKISTCTNSDFSSFGSIPYLDHSPGASPLKCTTPVADFDDYYEKVSPDTNIRETLDEVRARLMYGVERRMLKMRCHVQTIRDTSSQYMHSIKDTGSHYVQSLRESSSYAANRVRAGVVLGVEQVKYHVQSIKELCGTGEMGSHTVSTISVSTDVDTQRRTEIIKSYTYV
ncbi:leucine-rich repeat and fibronectin type-III domain-containing protein 5-like [Octopus vulgaris]|uniref:Leucine-rich repeat and fibronectin type-III domain-containing protein 5-like n=1 Tax=Octopus vulgaris TaxID=6645 RepID=A0AA36BW73_OCTVU|nr:leucine-rich repeat and fibronectin type-III domain-containing protein 5-like [Octopus vulgaris]